MTNGPCLDLEDFNSLVVIESGSSANREAPIFYGNLSRNGEPTTSTPPGSRWFLKGMNLQVSEAQPETKYGVLFTLEERGCLQKRPVSNTTTCVPLPSCCIIEKTTGTYHGSSVLAVKVIIFDLSSKRLSRWSIWREAAMNLALIALNSLNEKNLSNAPGEEMFLLSFFL